MRFHVLTLFPQMIEQIMNMPAVALRGLTILPGMIAHFDISRERSLRAVEEAMEQDQKIYLVTQRNVDLCLCFVHSRLTQQSMIWTVLYQWRSAWHVESAHALRAYAKQRTRMPTAM